MHRQTVVAILCLQFLLAAALPRGPFRIAVVREGHAGNRAKNHRPVHLQCSRKVAEFYCPAGFADGLLSTRRLAQFANTGQTQLSPFEEYLERQQAQIGAFVQSQPLPALGLEGFSSTWACDSHAGNRLESAQ